MKRLALLLAAFAVIAGALSVYWVGGQLAAPAPREIGAPPADLPGRAVKVPSPAAGVLKGWLVPGRRDAGAVLLLHGVRASRLEMLGRARFLHARGYTVMLFDSRAHGESGGQRVTFGYLEGLDARALLGALRQAAPGERLGVIGISLGGVACLVGPQPLRVHALVLESVYPTLEEAIDNRLAIRLGALGPPLAPLLTMQLRPRLGFGVEDLRPIDSVDRVGAPLLVIAGTEDRHTTIVQSRRLFARAQAPKELWEVPGAGHVNYHRVAPAEYEARVGGFLARHLRDAPR
ncbi:MAG TPA: alpha/beta fold hydrolase [Pseudomonadales bacterium]|nr:alpha/beta fold hydrolase [Pseudomonadales bacterium]